ncbi:cytochrome P450 family protein [Marinitenerispora sediminis]|uniref:Cytochrome P450 n=1 Tax=Marinitenerispora sediminis TaxID=1931232 RepID=A0A368T0E9_9ACTN|nr:cytochrome P450 [Marinitenerispora sediminis]RCV49089.1 cytochrome P450 [Marinitenerispora sediminis]RCV49269.1 cytochrome P450 [Marinitenerispora sediminis]RCV52391.1 cytochrome P450 [Marinitenerispora sediminis]
MATSGNFYSTHVGEHPGEPNLADPELVADPYGGYGRLREQAPVLRARYLDGAPIWLVTRLDEVRTVLSDPRFVNDPSVLADAPPTASRRAFVEGMGIPEDLAPYLFGTILDLDAPDHTRLRKLVSRTFTVRRVGELRPRVEEITERLLDELPARAEDGVVDLVECFGYPLPITVICELVGVPEEDRPRWREWGRQLVPPDPATLGSILRAMVDHIADLIKRRRSQPASDLLTGLIRTHDEDGDRLSDTEMIAMVLTLVVAGHETTTHLISNGVAALLTHPVQLELLRSDPSLLPGAVHELMRWCGPVHATRLRYATEDVEVGGVTVHRGDAVQPVLVSANYDPRHTPEPERLDLTRRPAGRGESHVGFGYGIHYCLGAALARQEGEVAFGALLRRYPDLSLAVPAEELEWLPIPANRRLARLPVRLGG